ncbi:MAG: peptidoglycan DD-metalloendopeptidase family protein [Firmicutes bacterium]|nr:peptidoglycan DD-metalloendopeptidase family protein [Bacillota bacterium]
MAKSQKIKIMDRIWDIGAAVIVAMDLFFDDVFEAGAAGYMEFKRLGRWLFDFIIDAGATFIDWADHMLAVLEWLVTRTVIFILRRVYYVRFELHQYRKEILKTCVFLFTSMLGIVLLASSVIDYEYSYNGKTLGIVREQQDVLQILDLVSEELTLEYGSNISINPENDITFTAVISDGKEIDDIDTVLRKFTYMGDVQATAYALMVDGERMLVVESEQIANEVLDTVMNTYLKKNDPEKYEYVGFAEEIEIEPYNTTLASVTSKSSAINRLKSGGQKEETYKVVSGDTIYGICDKLNLSFKELKAMNPGLDIDDTLHIGDKFVIQKEVPLLTVETVEVSTFAESIDYETITKESSSYYIGDTVVTRAGQKGKARVTARLTKHNGDIVQREDLKVVTITEPVDKIVVKGTKVPPPKKGTGTFSRPVNTGVYRGYGMRWGRMHYGLDYAAPTGTPIYAADGGTVIKVGWHGNYGYFVKIDHGGGYQTLYAHNSRNLVSVGDKVFKGQKIAAVGNTGRSTGPHCHFEVFKYGKNINPASVL